MRHHRILRQTDVDSPSQSSPPQQSGSSSSCSVDRCGRPRNSNALFGHNHLCIIAGNYHLFSRGTGTKSTGRQTDVDGTSRKGRRESLGACINCPLLRTTATPQNLCRFAQRQASSPTSTCVRKKERANTANDKQREH